MMGFAFNVHKFLARCCFQNLANSFYGLQNMSSGHEEVRLVLAALGVKLRHFKGNFNPQEISSACFGMQNMSCFHAEVDEVVKLLTLKIKR